MQGQQFLVLIEARLSNLSYTKVQVVPQGPTLGALELGCVARFTRIFWTVCSGHQAICRGVGSWNKGVLSSISWYVVLLTQMI